MTITEALSDPELRRVLWACFDYWSTEPKPPDERAICYSWVVRQYKRRFGVSFHQSKLQGLTRLGLLSRDGDTSRGGHRRYYRINDSTQVAEFLRGCNLN